MAISYAITSRILKLLILCTIVRQLEAIPRIPNGYECPAFGGSNINSNAVVLADAKVTVFTHNNFQGNSFQITGLKKIGDCKEFWNPAGGVDPIWQTFNDRTHSIQLGESICVRLYEHNCAWTTAKARTLDTSFDSPWTRELSKMGFNGILSAVKLIECEKNEPALVTVFNGINYQGESRELHGLKKIGDCVEFFNPHGYQVMISNDLRLFTDQTKSIKLKDGICVRLYEHQCHGSGRVLDTTVISAWASNIALIGFPGISAVEVIKCPIPSGITLFKLKDFKGENLTLNGLEKSGDCVDLWNPHGKQISLDVSKFNDQVRSIKIPHGLCVRLYEGNCGGAGRTLEVMAENLWTSHLASQPIGGISAVELTCNNNRPITTTQAPLEGFETNIGSSITATNSLLIQDKDSLVTLDPESELFKMFKKIQNISIPKSIVDNLQANYQWVIQLAQDNRPFLFYTDFKNPPGKVAIGEIHEPDVTFTVTDDDFISICKEELNLTIAETSGWIYIDGNIDKAYALESSLKKIKRDMEK